jgi:hypothetical protein
MGAFPGCDSRIYIIQFQYATAANDLKIEGTNAVLSVVLAWGLHWVEEVCQY